MDISKLDFYLAPKLYWSTVIATRVYLLGGEIKPSTIEKLESHNLNYGDLMEIRNMFFNDKVLQFYAERLIREHKHEDLDYFLKKLEFFGGIPNGFF